MSKYRERSPEISGHVITEEDVPKALQWLNMRQVETKDGFLFVNNEGSLAVSGQWGDTIMKYPDGRLICISENDVDELYERIDDE